MKNWTAALGVRCQHCHVGEEGKPFSEWDFASDANPEKQRAREMWRMLEEINRRLAAMPEMHGAKPSSATCATCHHGVPRPLRIEDVFEETLARSGLDAALAEYRELRTKNLTRGAYDFGAMPLVRLARARLAAEDPAGAGKVLAMAVELGHDTLATRSTLAEAALAAGDRAGAVAHLEKALGMATNAAEREFVEEYLRKARGEGEVPKP
jgi:plasmid stabilization system protein ParE